MARKGKLEAPLIRLFTDGSSFNNGYKDQNLPQFSSSAYVITVDEEIIFKNHEGNEDSTNNFAELNAVFLGLTKIADFFEGKWSKYSPPYNIEVYSDSQYVILGLSRYLKKWVENKYKNSSNREISNIELWKKIKFQFVDNPKFKMKYFHVKAHTGNIDFKSQMNDLCDKLAMSKIQKMIKNLNIYGMRDLEKKVEKDIEMIYRNTYKNVDNNNHKSLIKKFNNYSNEFQLKILKKLIKDSNTNNDLKNLELDLPTEAALMFLFDLLKLDLDNPVVRKIYTELRIRLFDASKFSNTK